jgi:hypothetical protein
LASAVKPQDLDAPAQAGNHLPGEFRVAIEFREDGS